MQNIYSTMLVCTVTHNGATITEFSAHLVIPVLILTVKQRINQYASDGSNWTLSRCCNRDQAKRYRLDCSTPHNYRTTC